MGTPGLKLAPPLLPEEPESGKSSCPGAPLWLPSLPVSHQLAPSSDINEADGPRQMPPQPFMWLPLIWVVKCGERLPPPLGPAGQLRGGLAARGSACCCCLQPCLWDSQDLASDPLHFQLLILHKSPKSLWPVQTEASQGVLWLRWNLSSVPVPGAERLGWCCLQGRGGGEGGGEAGKETVVGGLEPTELACI